MLCVVSVSDWKMPKKGYQQTKKISCMCTLKDEVPEHSPVLNVSAELPWIFVFCTTVTIQEAAVPFFVCLKTQKPTCLVLIAVEFTGKSDPQEIRASGQRSPSDFTTLTLFQSKRFRRTWLDNFQKPKWVKVQVLVETFNFFFSGKRH